MLSKIQISHLSKTLFLELIDLCLPTFKSTFSKKDWESWDL